MHKVVIFFLISLILLASCANPVLNPTETFTPSPMTTQTATATFTPEPTNTLTPTPSFTPEPTRTPTPDFPHKIVDGKVVFDWSADLSTFPDITKGGSIPLTKELIFNWMNSLSVFYKLKSAQFIIEKVPTLKKKD